MSERMGGGGNVNKRERATTTQRNPPLLQPWRNATLRCHPPPINQVARYHRFMIWERRVASSHDCDQPPPLHSATPYASPLGPLQRLLGRSRVAGVRQGRCGALRCDAMRCDASHASQEQAGCVTHLDGTYIHSPLTVSHLADIMYHVSCIPSKTVSLTSHPPLSQQPNNQRTIQPAIARQPCLARSMYTTPLK